MRKKKIFFLLFLFFSLCCLETLKKKSSIIKTDRELKNEKNEQEIINQTNPTTITQNQNIINTIITSYDKKDEQKILDKAIAITVIQTQNLINTIKKSNIEINEQMNNEHNKNIHSTIIEINNITNHIIKKHNINSLINNLSVFNITNLNDRPENKTNEPEEKMSRNNIIIGTNINSANIITQYKTNITDIKTNKTTKIKKIGVISADHAQNIGNNLLKYAMFIKLKELGFEPYIIGYLRPGNNISFLNETINIRCIKKSFKEIKRNDYDILMVNSDQVWRKTNLNYLDVGFLRFASDWSIRKFIYGASFGLDYWIYYSYEERNIKNLLKNFSGISVREEGLKKMVEKHLNLEPTLVVDPTLLIDKKYYLDLIKNYKNEYTSKDNYIFVYSIDTFQLMQSFIKQSVETLKYKLYNCTMSDNDYLQKFIYGIYNSKAVITNSFHGVIFSIIFKKPFVAFNPVERGNERFNTLKNVYGLQNRIISVNNPPKLSLLTEPFDVNMKIIDDLREKSIDFLKKNLEID